MPPDYALPPLTIESLVQAFAACGLSAGQSVLMHSRLSAVRHWVIGGAPALLEALRRVLDLPARGTLMMPTQTGDNSEPSRWLAPPVPEAWWQSVRDHLPAFDPALTPTRGMGTLVETFRTLPGVRRSAHPIGSFAAWGRHADHLLRTQPLEAMFGDQSPLARLYDLDGWVLLLGVDHHSDTSLHLAEERAHWIGKTHVREGSAVSVNGERRWVTYEMLDYDTEGFGALGDAYEQARAASPDVRHGRVGCAQARFLRQRPLVDFAVDWLQSHRAKTEL